MHTRHKIDDNYAIKKNLKYILSKQIKPTFVIFSPDVIHDNTASLNTPDIINTIINHDVDHHLEYLTSNYSWFVELSHFRQLVILNYLVIFGLKSFKSAFTLHNFCENKDFYSAGQMIRSWLIAYGINASCEDFDMFEIFNNDRFKVHKSEMSN